MRAQLDQTLNELHIQLADIENLESDERVRLQQAVEEIQQSLDQDDINSHSLAERLSEATTQFSESYPSLANSVGRVADMLAQMGI